MVKTKELVETITKGIQEKKGHSIVVADLSGIEGAICNYFVICTGNSPTQVDAITDSVEEFAREKAVRSPSMWWAARMHNGLRWITRMCWYISSYPTCANTTIWRRSGRMPRSPAFLTWTKINFKEHGTTRQK